MDTLEESSGAKDFSWESKIEEADEIEKEQGNMPQVGMGVTYFLYEAMNFRGIGFTVPLIPLLLAAVLSLLVCAAVPVVTWMILEKNGSIVERIKGVE